MPYLLLAITIPLIIIAVFFLINSYYDKKEARLNQPKENKYPDEVNRLLEHDETESFYHN